MAHYIDPAHWCIVRADEPGTGLLAEGGAQSSVPVQFSPVGEAATPFRRALHRAAALAPNSQVMITVAEGQRVEWESSSWLVRPERRFIAESLAGVSLTLAAAIMVVAAHSTANVITILPARCTVTEEGALQRAIRYAIAELPDVPEGMATLGMLDLEEPIDEDYLLVERPRGGSGLELHRLARRPVPWVARHLRDQGALVASGILVGYAGAFAAHLSMACPKLSIRLARLGEAAARLGAECKIPSAAMNGIAPAILRSIRLQPPTLPLRVFGVARSGWCGLKSANAVAHRAAFCERAARIAHTASSGRASPAEVRLPEESHQSIAALEYGS